MLYGSTEIRDRRCTLRYRHLLVRQMVQMKNRISGLLMEAGASHNKQRLHKVGYFRELLATNKEVGESIRRLLKLSRETIVRLQKTEYALVSSLERDPVLAERLKNLRTVPGVGPITELTWAREIGDVSRFRSVKQAISYCGLGRSTCEPAEQRVASFAEVGEGRAQIEENIVRSHMSPTQSGKRMSQGLHGVLKAATERKQKRFTALLHHLTIDLLRDSFYALQRRAAPGVDGVTWREYESGLEDRLVDLHNRVHRRAYRAQPSRRVYIPKADGRQRPLGIAALEDKLVQQAVVTILNQIYEVDFKGFSYGFRPGRGPHQALDALNVGIFPEASELGARCGHSRVL
jgi:hypothetical protein